MCIISYNMDILYRFFRVHRTIHIGSLSYKNMFSHTFSVTKEYRSQGDFFGLRGKKTCKRNGKRQTTFLAL